jgi:hypothetical protein
MNDKQLQLVTFEQANMKHFISRLVLINYMAHHGMILTKKLKYFYLMKFYYF